MSIVLGPNQYGKAENRVGDKTLVSGFSNLVILKSTGSEFHDFLVDKYVL